MADKLLGLRNYTRRTFPRHFLNAVHAEVGFSGTSVDAILAAEEKLKPFFKSKGLGECRKIVQGQFSMENLPDKPVSLSHRASPIGLEFSSSKPRRIVQVLDTKIIFSDLGYEGFDSFKGLFNEFCTSMSQHVPRYQINKVGLRKINSIAIEPVVSYQDACAIFNPVLFSNLKSGLIPQDALKVHEEVSVIERGSHLCVIRAKMSRLPAPNAYEAILDFDFVNLTPTSLEQVFTEALPELNDAHFDLFMWAASDELIELMETK